MKKNILQFLFINIFITTSLNAFAQGDVPNIDFSKRTERKDGFLDKDDETPDKAEHIPFKRAINIDATGILGGYFAINYEQKIRNNLSIEGSIGMTFASLSNNIYNNIFNNNTPMEDDAVDFWKKRNLKMIATSKFPGDYKGMGNLSDIQHKVGVYAMVEPRFFPQSQPFDGFFIGLRLQTQYNPLLYRSPFSTTDGGRLNFAIYNQLPIQVDEVLVDAIPQFGWEWQRNHLLLGLEGGIGPRFTTHYNAFSVGEIANGTQLLRVGGTQSGIFPVFNMIFRMGYEF